ncbi:MAG: DNA/RNA non-specific endonuclease [Acinetobacter pseudolwoffii]
MAKKQRKSKNSFFQFLNDNSIKVILGVVASSSFAIAFGQEKISQWVSLSSSSNSACLDQFYRDVPPYLIRPSLKSDTYSLCFNGFNMMYSGVSKTPLWVAEALTVSRLSQKKIPREDSFHEETAVKPEHRATLADYRGSGYDRGHMAPNADMSNKAAQSDSFSLANMIPQAPKNNQQVWRELEEATRAIVTKQKQDVYVVTGPVFTPEYLKKTNLSSISQERTNCKKQQEKNDKEKPDQKSNVNKKLYNDCIAQITPNSEILVPKYVYKALYIPKTGVSGVYYAPNDNSLKVRIVSVCYLEEQLGINLFPQLTEEQKRNTYRLPLTAKAVKANQKIEYSNWDAESQCAEEVSEENLQALQREFKSSGSSSSSSSATGGMIDNEKQLIDALLQYILQLLK